MTPLIIYETARLRIDLTSLVFSGRILDVGGGGEGVISRHSGQQVVAIDNRAEELAGTPDLGIKLLANDCALPFLDEYFHHVTCFYTLLYMEEEEVRSFLGEACRVLKQGGRLWVWDTVIPAVPQADVFVAQVEVRVSQELILTPGYGVPWRREQSPGSIRSLCEETGFVLVHGEEGNESFFLCFEKT